LAAVAVITALRNKMALFWMVLMVAVSVGL
jgi:hypothetical protein